MTRKCYELRRASRRGPWVDGQELWERVSTTSGQADEWEDVARRLLAMGKHVACCTCGALPGVVWVEGKSLDGSQGRDTTQDYVCGPHAVRGPVEALRLHRGSVGA